MRRSQFHFPTPAVQTGVFGCVTCGCVETKQNLAQLNSIVSVSCFKCQNQLSSVHLCEFNWVSHYITSVSSCTVCVWCPPGKTTSTTVLGYKTFLMLHPIACPSTGTSSIFIFLGQDRDPLEVNLKKSSLLLYTNTNIVLNFEKCHLELTRKHFRNKCVCLCLGNFK